MAVLLGSSAAGVDAANSNTAGNAFGVRLQCLASGTVDFIYVKSADAVTNRRGALYADNAGQLTGATRLSGDISPPTAVSGWHRYTVSPGVAVTSGTFYWLEFLSPLSGGATYNYTDNATSGGTTRDTASSLNALAATHPTTTASFTNRFNAYAEGTPSGGAASLVIPRRAHRGLYMR